MTALPEAEFIQIMNTFTVQHLKEALKQLNANTTANKPELRIRLLQQYNTNPVQATAAVQIIQRRIQTYHATMRQLQQPAVAAAAAAAEATSTAAARFNVQQLQLQQQSMNYNCAYQPAAPCFPPTPSTAATIGLPPHMISQIEALQLGSQQSMMDRCRVLGALIVDKISPRVNTVTTLAMDSTECQGVFSFKPATHQIKVRLVLFHMDTRQFSLPHIWPTGCTLRINAELIFDTCVTPASMMRPTASPLPAIDISHLPSKQYSVQFSAHRKASNVNWYVVIFTMRKKPKELIQQELFARSPALEHSMRRMLAMFDSEVACIDPITLKLRDPVSMALMSIPVRSMHCQHLQCFDFFTFLEINSKSRSPKWKCPLCGQNAAVELLVVDRWFMALFQKRNLANRVNAFQVRISPPNGELEFIDDEPDESSSSDEEEDEPAAKRFQIAVSSPSPLHFRPPPLPQPTPPRLGNTPDEAILLLDDDDDLF